MAKLDLTGQLVWLRQFGSDLSDDGRGIAVGNAVYMAGGTHGTLPRQDAAGGVDSYLAKFRPGGGRSWIRQFGTSDTDTAASVDPLGRGAVVAGQAFGDLNSQTELGGHDAYAAEFSSSGRSKWTLQFGTDQNDIASSVAASPRLVVAGYTEGSLSGEGPFGGLDAFVVRLQVSH